MILPGATLGVVGGGQLGRMFLQAARRMGYRVAVLDPDPASPAGTIADLHLKADYADEGALARMAQTCVAVTTEFETVPARALERLAAETVVRPGAAALHVAQDRIREKTFLEARGLPTARFRAAATAEEAAAAAQAVAGPVLVKRAAFGYDGKGQVRAGDPREAAAGFAELGDVPCVVEARVALAAELSVVLARSVEGEVACYAVGENVHRGGILDTTTVPAAVPAAIARQARGMAAAVADALDYAGVLAVEFFLTPDEELLINEIAPRPHNSGHHTLDACATSQFEQQVRVLCGLPPGDIRLLSAAVMVNLLGELWDPVPRWEAVLRDPAVKLHLYGKAEPRPGRKMGHLTCLAPTREEARRIAARARWALRIDRADERGEGAGTG